MESLSNERRQRQQKSKMLSGIFVISFGVIFLLSRLNFDIPYWLISWKTILISVGIVGLYRHNFKHFSSYILITIGTLFLLKGFYPHFINTQLILPILVIVLGTIMLFKGGNMFGKIEGNTNKKFTAFDSEIDFSSDDFLTLTTIFGGVTKNVVSKNFKGADIKIAFGGTEINLTKADIQGPITINSTSAFAGLTLIVPSTWKVQSELLTVFGGIEDKRPILNTDQQDPNKVLILHGNCFFSGVEIQSYI
ncbi:MAG: cell wall-active antibiotics response protein [Crocinitomicaceae bacterium]|nr:cell wall-active antibiotics response protein [Crocinitomicaceae bacterium]